jgi:cell division protein FtsQ
LDFARKLPFYWGIVRPERAAAATDPAGIVVDARPRNDVREAGPRRGWFRRRRNRRVPLGRFSFTVWVADGVVLVGRKLVTVVKVVAAVALLAGAAWGAERAVRHVIASPRFALRDVRVTPTSHVDRESVLALAALTPGERLLAVDTDAVAARVATHPWVAAARVRRELPSALVIDIVERRAAAAVLLGALYLVDGAGHPFKRAALEEADGLPVLTGLAREQYTAHRAASEAAFREALDLLEAYRAGDGRPALSEVHIDPRFGFSLVLFDGGGEIRLGRGDTAAKLARLDRIVAALGPHGAAAVRAVHLEGDAHDRVTLLLSSP